MRLLRGQRVASTLFTVQYIELMRWCIRMITTVLFDMGGTLEELYKNADIERNCYNAIYSLLLHHGLDPIIDVDEFRYRISNGWKSYHKAREKDMRCVKPAELWCNYLLADFKFERNIIESISEELSCKWELSSYRRTLRPHSFEMLEGIKSLGLKLGIISDTPSLYQVFETLERYGIRHFFQDVTLSTFVGYRKPHQEMFQLSLRQMRSRAEECIYVGDTVRRDVIGCKQAGFAKAIQIPSVLAYSDNEVETQWKPDYIISNIYEVFEIVKQLLLDQTEVQETICC